MLLLYEVKQALDENRTFDVQTEVLQQCHQFEDLLLYLPQLFQHVDQVLFRGALTRYFRTNQIPFHVVRATNGPAGLTTYDMIQGMKICIHERAWVEQFPAMVGGTLCHRADTCIIKVFLHEMIHVLLFAIYLELDFSPLEIQSSFLSHFDPTHNILFTEWLRRFFGQDTIDNSLLLHTKTDTSLVFNKTVQEIEHTCLFNTSSNLQVLHNGQWQDCKLVLDKETKPHHSYVQIISSQKPNRKKTLLVSNGLLRCSS